MLKKLFALSGFKIAFFVTLLIAMVYAWTAVVPGPLSRVLNLPDKLWVDFIMRERPPHDRQSGRWRTCSSSRNIAMPLREKRGSFRACSERAPASRLPIRTPGASLKPFFSIAPFNPGWCCPPWGCG